MTATEAGTQWTRSQPPAPILAAFPGARLWVRLVPDGLLRVLRTYEQHSPDEGFLLHLSISHTDPSGEPGRYPTWDEQREAVWRFAPKKHMLHRLPPEGESYVNVHRTTFHWWEDPDV